MSFEVFYYRERNKTAEYPASRRFVDENGDPVKWKIRVISGGEDERLRESCTKVTPLPGKEGIFLQGMDQDAYMRKLAAACTLYPDLREMALQSAYGAENAEELLETLLDIGEYQAYVNKVQEVNGF